MRRWRGKGEERGLAGLGKAGHEYGKEQGLAWHGRARLGWAGRGEARQGEAGNTARRGKARLGEVRQGKVQGVARLGMARQGMSMARFKGGHTK